MKAILIQVDYMNVQIPASRPPLRLKFVVLIQDNDNINRSSK